MAALVLVQNEVTAGGHYDFWDDVTGVRYNFPNQYLRRFEAKSLSTTEELDMHLAAEDVLSILSTVALLRYRLIRKLQRIRQSVNGPGSHRLSIMYRFRCRSLLGSPMDF
jgi:hypothetical protein